MTTPTGPSESSDPCPCAKRWGPDATNYHALTERLRAAEDVVRAVLSLHRDDGNDYCDHCPKQEYPCATSRALGVPIPTDAKAGSEVPRG